MPEKNPHAPKGREPNEPCPDCNAGRLKAVLRTEEGPRDQFGPPTIRERIERLGCSYCGRSYEAAARGQDLAGLLLEQALGFANPETRPTSCPSCHEKLKEGPVFDDKHPMYRGNVREMTILSCPGCLKVAYVIHPERASAARA